MTQHPLLQPLTDLAAPLAAGLGLDLWGIEFAAGGRSLIRVFVESEQGVDIEQCAELSRLLGLTLDVEDIVPGAYVLEVSSPGLERTFFSPEQLARAAGQTVEITLHDPHPSFPGRRKFRGVLAAAPQGDATGAAGPDDFFSLRLDEAALPGEDPALVRFAFSSVKKARQLLVLPEKTLPGKQAKKKKPSPKARNTAVASNKQAATSETAYTREATPELLAGTHSPTPEDSHEPGA